MFIVRPLSRQKFHSFVKQRFIWSTKFNLRFVWCRFSQRFDCRLPGEFYSIIEKLCGSCCFSLQGKRWSTTKLFRWCTWRIFQTREFNRRSYMGSNPLLFKPSKKVKASHYYWQRIFSIRESRSDDVFLNLNPSSIVETSLTQNLYFASSAIIIISA